VPKPIQHHHQAVVLSSRCHQVLGNAPDSMSTITSITSLPVHPTALLTPPRMPYRNNLRNHIIHYLFTESRGLERPTYSMRLGTMLKSSSPVYAFATLILKNSPTILLIRFATTRVLLSSRSTAM